MATSSEQNQDRFQRRPAVEAMTGLSRSSIYSKMDPRSPQHDPEFPKPVRLGKRAVAWRESDILAWMNGRQSTAA
ncbi:AlpA family phage regulatory protein [Pseudoruegeria sp. M32A2M]|nr:AlpA family phage regulatory protein [Aliiruegeria sabulilitoris]NDR59199.1 AlpA family phage regulatory protein [Pseudoruegeria sp. M32A2M]